jgi:hypothetical protein
LNEELVQTCKGRGGGKPFQSEYWAAWLKTNVFRVMKYKKILVGEPKKRVFMKSHEKTPWPKL